MRLAQMEPRPRHHREDGMKKCRDANDMVDCKASDELSGIKKVLLERSQEVVTVTLKGPERDSRHNYSHFFHKALNGVSREQLQSMDLVECKAKAAVFNLFYHRVNILGTD